MSSTSMLPFRVEDSRGLLSSQSWERFGALVTEHDMAVHFGGTVVDVTTGRAEQSIVYTKMRYRDFD